MSNLTKSLIFLLPALLLILLLTHFSGIRDSFLPASSNKKALRTEFLEWSRFYNRSYASESEFELRFKLWRKNRRFVEKHNTDASKTHKLALNHFADRTDEERQSYTRGHRHHHHHGGLVQDQSLGTELTQLPVSVDWRAHNAVTAIKDQGHCGGCWAFSTIVGIEGLYAIKNGSLKVFSEQNLLDCSHLGPNSGCSGGDPQFAYNYTKGGIETDEEYPFAGVDQKCMKNLSLPAFKIQGYAQVPPNDNLALAAAVARQPVSICIDGDQTDFLLYTGGIYQSPDCTTNLGHCLAIVGYGTEDGTDYWIVKNSYGTTWGEGGFIRMIKQNETGPGICGITLEAVYPVSL